jgi:hypothetical protein
LIGPGFPAEPWNAYSSLVIVLFGVASLALVVKRAARSSELYALCGLLVFNGIGSFLWHGMRARWALAFDVFPALAFLLAIMFVWSRSLFSLWKSTAVILAFFAILGLQRWLDLDLTRIGIWVALAPPVVLVALWLIAGTLPLSRSAAIYGGLSLVFALVGLGFRTMDRAACAYLPSGTHFLWHVFLSLAAFLGVWTLIILVELKTGGIRPKGEVVVATA